MSEDTRLHELAQPNPEALIESLRSFGYSQKTAIADIIDNSIDANASNVWLYFEWSGKNTYIIIKDDGNGMSEAELLEAMRPGSRSPKEKRSSKKLGRFGLGLKTASFSQCRKLTVFSKQQNFALSSRCWDLDYVGSCKEWRLLKDIDETVMSKMNESIDQKGTVVLWENLDRVVGNADINDLKAVSHFLSSVDEIKEHLSMVFHRFIDKKILKIWINDRQIKSWDPFLRFEHATQELPTEELDYNGDIVVVTPYVLPHKSKLSDATFECAAGPNGWTSQQGFYVYRNERLLVSGDWLGLGLQKEDYHKLSRIMIDLPNSMDKDWELDIKKSRARPPSMLKNSLKKIALLTRERALDVYRHRGRVLNRSSGFGHVFLWQQKVRHDKFYFTINRDHPLVLQAKKNPNEDNVDSLLSILEQSLPLSTILLNNMNSPEKCSAPFEGEPPEILFNVLQSSIRALRNSALGIEEIKIKILNTDPFNLFPEYVKEVLANYQGENNV